MFINWQGSDINPVIITPDDEEIELENYQQYQHVKKFVKRERYCFSQIKKPQPGEWKVKLNPQDFSEKGELVHFNVAGTDEEDIYIRIGSIKPWCQRDEYINLIVKPFQFSKKENKLIPILEGMDISVSIIRPGASAAEVWNDPIMAFLKSARPYVRRVLKDNGENGDEIAGDGVYTAIYRTKEDGPHGLKISVKWKKKDGKKIERVIKKNFYVGY